ncbi:MAG: ABC transporter transmembrane domain-containing protein, partial [bacterium]|nr:ABC transporter transmembrane domain-containing protein [bacterium]
MAKAFTDFAYVMGFRAVKGQITLLSLFKPYYGQLCLGFIYLLLTNALVLYLPRLINIGIQLIDGEKVGASSTLIDFTSMSQLSLAIVVLSLTAALVRILSRRTLFNVGRYIEADLRQKLFFHLSLLSFDFYKRRSVGDLMNHLTTDINNVRLSSGFATLNIFNVVIIFSGTLPILISINPKLALASMLPFVLVMLASKSLSRRLFDRVKNYQASLSQLTEHVQENLSASQVVRVFHQEENEEKKFSVINEDNYRVAKRLANIRSLMFPFTRMMVGLGLAIALYIGGREIILGTITIGDFVEVNARLLQLSWPAI